MYTKKYQVNLRIYWNPLETDGKSSNQTCVRNSISISSQFNSIILIFIPENSYRHFKIKSILLFIIITYLYSALYNHKTTLSALH